MMCTHSESACEFLVMLFAIMKTIYLASSDSPVENIMKPNYDLKLVMRLPHKPHCNS